MKNLLFFLWMMFFPLVEDIANWVIWKTKSEEMKNDWYERVSGIFTLILYLIVGWLLYER